MDVSLSDFLVGLKRCGRDLLSAISSNHCGTIPRRWMCGPCVMEYFPVAQIPRMTPEEEGECAPVATSAPVRQPLR